MIENQITPQESKFIFYTSDNNQVKIEVFVKSLLMLITFGFP
jgi:hypothetical protein